MDLADIHKPLKEKEEWDTPVLCIDLYENPGDEGSVLPGQNNLATWLPQEVTPYYHTGGGRHKDKRLWFGRNMKNFADIAEKLNIESCTKVGYSVHVASTKRGLYCHLRCDCHGKAKASKATKNTTQSTKTQDEDERPSCPWYITIYKDEEHKEYYMRQNGGHNLHHSGHTPTQQSRRVQKRHIPKDAVGEVEELLWRRVDPDIIQEFIDMKHGVQLNKNSIKKMKQTVLLDKFKEGGEKEETTAQTLLRMLENNKNLDYVAYFGSYQEAEDTVRVRKQSKRGKKTKVIAKTKNKPSVIATADVQQVPLNTAGAVSGSDEKLNADKGGTSTTMAEDGMEGEVKGALAEDAAELNDVTIEAKSFVKNLIKQLTTGDGTILLAVMWITDEGKKYHTKFPHVLGCDVTFGTNAEKRPLFRASGKTSDNKNIPHINAFVPSQQRWVFEWIFEDGFPSILDRTALSKTCMILTDQDTQLVGTLLAKLHEHGRIRTYGWALNRLCSWHKYDRGYDMMIKSFAKTDKDNQFKTTIIHWLWHFTKNIEYYDQEVDSYNKLLAFVALAEKDTEFSEGLVSNTSKFLRESFYPYLSLLSLRRYHAVYCGNVCESCWVESDNAALKTDQAKPKPNNKLYVSADAIIHHTDKRMNNLAADAAVSARSQLLPKPSDTKLDTIRQVLSKNIVSKR